MAGARIAINEAAWGREVKRISKKSAERAAEQLKTNLRMEVLAAGRVQTGRLANDWEVAVIPARTLFGYRLAVYTRVSYARYQNDGTRGSKPVRAKALRFSPNGGPAIFRMKSGPIPAARFMERAVGSMKVSDWAQ